MDVVVSSRVVGTFLGYAPGVVHRLDDGSEWEQVGNVTEYACREWPGCRVVRGHERLWIDVEGTGGVAEVQRYWRKRWAGESGQ